ncbi:hypothetical protein CBW65_04395 [Tumebacillus avium]|uniref:Peptidase M16 C-terminal domain-containing protein n=1 Tax=Tumebacillus avium TaxID=1903704 RepID=A0A1Y0IJ98_9BACL|nr:pitrilysin family protein [Tumebacillus avium]ARU60390.1 hypothetical protein CBW65_04395 [Tumebacillus avium]
MNVRCYPNPGSKTVNLLLWLPVGAFQDPSDMRGLSHVAEHLFFTRQVELAGQTIVPMTAVEGVGGQVDAATYREMTRYQMRVHHGTWKQDLKLLLQLFRNSHVDPHCVEVEKQSIRSELLEYSEYPDVWANVLSEQGLFGANNPYSAFIGGEPDDLEAITASAVSQFWNTIDPDRLLLQVMGDVTREEVLAVIQEVLQDSAFAESNLYVPIVIDPPVCQFGIVHQPSENELTTLGLSIPMPGTFDPDFPVAKVLKELLAGTSTSRLYASLRQRHRMIYVIEGSYEPTTGYGVLNLVTTFEEKNTSKVLELVFSELNQILHDGFTAQELQGIKKYLELKHHLMLDSANDYMKWLGRMIMQGKDVAVEAFLEQISAVTLDQVNELYRTCYGSCHLGIGLIGGNDDHRDEIERLYQVLNQTP